MNYVLSVARDKPVGLWALGKTPFVDHSGYARAGSYTGAVGKSIGLASGTTHSTVFSSTDVGKFESPVFIQGKESNPFSLGAWFYVIDDGSTGEQQVLGHAGAGDGIVVNGTKVAFVTKYLTADESRAEYDLQIPRAVAAVGVHLPDRNSLYVNGVLVAEVEITNEQMNDSFVATDGFLYSGESTSTKALAVNGVSIFSYALSAPTIDSHYRAGRRVVGTHSHNLYGGTPINFSKAGNLLNEKVWTEDSNWRQGSLRGLIVDSGDIVPQILSGISVPGEWLDSCDLYTAGIPSPLEAINLTWDGEGVVIEASVDGSTWETAERGKNLAIIPSGFDPTQKELYVRASFPGGIVDDESYLSSLSVSIFSTDTVTVGDNRTVTLTQPAYVHNEYPAEELRDDWGVELDGGEIDISASTTSDAPQTIEVWAKGDYTTNLSGGTEYVNGVSGAVSMGGWAVTHYVGSTFTEPINFSGNAIIGKVVLYADELTSDQISSVYESYISIPSVRVGDNSVVEVTEPAEASNIYAYDWSIESAG